MRDAWLIARVTFRAILRNKVIYLILILGVILKVPTLLASFYFRMARQAGEAQMAEAIAAQSVVASLNLWFFTAAILGLVLGASAVPSEIKTRTIVTVLAKPLERFVFLTGKWIGVQLFLAIFAGAGVLLALALLVFFGVPSSGVFWIAVGHRFVAVLALSSFGLLLSTVVSPVVAGGLGFALFLLSAWSAQVTDHAVAAIRIPAWLIFYFSPARLDDIGANMGLGESALDPDYVRYLAVLGENVFWAVAALVAASLIFGRREVRIR